MIGYRYDLDGYIFSEVQLQESPLEPGVYLMPPFTTTTAPPSPAPNSIAKFNGTTWSMQPNYSGTVYYKKSDKTIKTFQVGEAFDTNYTSAAPPSPDYSYVVWSEISGAWVEDSGLKNTYLINQCRTTAQGLLTSTDWLMTTDIYNNLTNQAALNTYRLSVYALYANPVANPTFPEPFVPVPVTEGD